MGQQKPSGRNLTQKQSDFGRHYAASGNGTDAARLAGYAGSESVLGVTAFDNLRNPKIAAFIEELRRDAEQKLQKRIMTAAEVKAELSEIALVPWNELVEIKPGEAGDVIHASIKLTDKIKACELMGKIHKLFTEKVEHSHIFESALSRLRADLPDIPEADLRAYAAETLQIGETIQ